ncbi:transcriptional regulator [Thalassotalea litorea]|uniref:transcriptional regulator n=1 Tax=Thalassotalea litorea TaxID=2020715 RepID=UPI001484D3D5|nr:transcriptional regulator [Thalassotalea litorea]
MIYRLTNIDIDTSKFEVRVDGKRIHVEPKLFDLIAYLIKNRDRIISREELFQEVWLGRDVSDTTLSNHINSARKLLGDNAETQQVIKTIRSRGYQFIGNVEDPKKLDDQKETAVSSLLKPLETLSETTPALISELKPELKPELKTEPVAIPEKAQQSHSLSLMGHLFTKSTWMFLVAIALVAVVLSVLNTKPAQDSETLPYLLVVPFSVSSHEPRQWQPFADQLTRELIQDLRKISALKALPPPSSFAFKKNKHRDYIRSQLPDVDYVLDGVVSEAMDGSIQITAEVEHLASGRLIWNGDFSVNRDQSSVFAIQNEIASAVSDALQVLLVKEEKRALAHTPTQVPAAHKLYTQGQFQLSQMTHQSVLNSIQLFNRAIVLDPQYEQAYFAKSNAYRLLMTTYEPPKDVFPKVVSSATDVLTLSPDSAEIKSSLGLAYVHVWLWKDAWKMLNESWQADNTIANTQLGFALYYSAIGDSNRVKQALAMADKLDPLNPEIADWGIWALMMGDDIEAAVAFAHQKINLNPELPHAYTALAVAEYIRGDLDKSLSMAEQGVKLSHGEPYHKIILAQAYAAKGRVKQAETLLLDVEQLEQYVCPYETAMVYLLLKDTKQAFQYFDKALDNKSNCLMFIRNDPRLKTLKNDRRYLSLLTAVGLNDDAIGHLINK